MQNDPLKPFLYLFLGILITAAARGQLPLVTGTWLKVGVTTSGVVEIKASEVQKKYNATITGRNIQVFGFTQRQLPQANTAVAAAFREVAVEVSDTDGNFAGNDYLRFYAQGPNEITITDSLTFIGKTHAYSDTAYYFIQLNAPTAGKRLAKTPTVLGASAKAITAYDDVYFYENEAVNLEKSGREWFGEFFNAQTAFTLPLTHLVPDSEIRLYSSVLGTVKAPSKVAVLWNDTPVGVHALAASRYDARDPFYRYSRRGFIDNQPFTFKSSGDAAQLSYRFDTPVSSPSGAYINSFLVHSQRELRFYDGQTHVQNLAAIKQDTATFRIANYTTGNHVWEITDAFAPTTTELTINGTQASFTTLLPPTVKKYILFSEKNVLTATSMQLIENQDIELSNIPDLLIITPRTLREEAGRLADFRRSNDGLDVAVISVESILNAYSGGMTDPTAVRNYIRNHWRKSPEKLKYVLLFGDATFDYKNKLKLAENGAFFLGVPTYESRESLEPVYSHSSDDYFGFLEDNEGQWREGESINGIWSDRNTDEYTLDVGIGRLPVRNAVQAREVVNKLIYYGAAPRRFGSWRTRLSFLADDEDVGYDYNVHLKDADALANIAARNEALALNKIYLGALPQESTPNGSRSPTAKAALNQAVEEGSLVINYNGHGSEDGWTDEKVLTIEQLINWRNLNTLPLMLTATCEFGRYDNPGVVSGAELALLNPKGGAVGLLTTTRPVYSNTNFLLNQAFYNALNQPLPHQRLGDIFRETKNASVSGMANRNFVLLGDPSLHLALPTDTVKLLTINGLPPEGQQLKALQKVTLNGTVGSGKFNGTVRVTVFDKAVEQPTLTQNNAQTTTFKTYRNVIFSGEAPVIDGGFGMSFVVPKDIDYRLGDGNMLFYAVAADSTSDAAGGFRAFKVGGSETNFAPDTTPPEVELSIDQNNVLTAIIRDESGINLSQTGIGHEILLTLNDTLSIVVNPYYVATKGYTEGVVRYPFGHLPPGDYTTYFKVWDTYNNVGGGSLSFKVAEQGLGLRIVNTFPNPTTGKITIDYEHLAAQRDLSVSVRVYNKMGQLIHEVNNSCYFCDSPNQVALNLANMDLPNGLYIYHLGLRDTTNGRENYVSGKIIVWK